MTKTLTKITTPTTTNNTNYNTHKTTKKSPYETLNTQVVATLKYDIPRMYAHHTQDSKDIEVRECFFVACVEVCGGTKLMRPSHCVKIRYVTLCFIALYSIPYVGGLHSLRTSENRGACACKGASSQEQRR
jgi:hypothetical protein